MKALLLVPLLVAAVATAQSAAVKTTSAHYLLLEPASTIEIDFGGDCVRLTNVSDGLVYLLLTSASDWRNSLRTASQHLKIESCGKR